MRTTLLLIASSFLAAGQSGPAPNYAPAKADAFLATNDPDRFAWQLFCAITRRPTTATHAISSGKLGLSSPKSTRIPLSRPSGQARRIAQKH